MFAELLQRIVLDGSHDLFAAWIRSGGCSGAEELERIRARNIAVKSLLHTS
jgi:hypothetical protein